MIKLFIVEDDQLVRDCLKTLLSATGEVEVIGDVGSGEEAFKRLTDQHPDVVLMDMSLPGISGIQATEKLVRRSPDLRVLIVTAAEEVSVANKALQAGARGYLTKTTGYEEMLRAIKVIHLGQKYITAGIAQDLAIQRITGIKSKSPFEQLSRQETIVARHVVAGKKPKAIAEMLCISDKTVNSYRYRIFKKTGAKNDNALTRLAIQHGFCEEAV